MSDSEFLARTVANALLEKKAEDIRMLDVRGLTGFTDYFVVATALSDTHGKSLADHVMVTMKGTAGELTYGREGLDTQRWIVLDYVNVVVHIFLRDVRVHYGLERMWSDAKVTEVADP